MAIKKIKRFTITITPEISKKLEDGNYNKNKLINKLLKDYLKRNKK